MKVVIVDDEAHIIKTLKHYLSQNALIEVVGTAGSVKQAVDVIAKTKPDTLFLDVELNDQLSFDILKQLPYRNYNIVFITAHAHYAIKAIRFSAFDYLLKPIHPDQLHDAIQRLSEETKKTSIENKLSALEENLKQQNRPKRLVLKTAEKCVIINKNDIIRLEADNTYTSIYLLERAPLVISRSLKHFEELLCDDQFIRTHRSHIVNLLQVSEYVKSNGGYIVMNNGDNIPLSANKKTHFMDLLNC